MSSIFLKLVNMSVSASWLILAVAAFRLVLRRTPKAIVCALWGLVALRLILPFHFESMFSLVPSAQTIPMNIAMEPRPAIDSGIAAIDQVVNPVLVQSMAPAEAASANPLQIWIPVLSVIWLLGMAVMLTYALVSYLRLCRRVRVSLHAQDNVYLCDQVESPFILGILRPRIYFPSDMADGEYRYVLAHERAHLRRRDNLWKPVGYLLLCVYWFNPLCWLAYILLCRDIELACDEKALRSLGVEQKKAYSRALLSCSVSRGSIAACPVAFGMVGVKQRVQAVLHYKKPAFWVVQVGILACILGAVCFLTDPVQAEEETAREHYEAYRQSFATGTAQETAELMWFPNEYVAETYFFDGYSNYTIDTREFKRINDDLWVATNVGHLSDGEYEYYNFVARMDGGWKVIQDVRDIPEQLRTNLDSTLYDHHDDPDIMPRQPSELIQCYGELRKFAEPVKIEVDSSIADGKNPYPDEDYPYPPGSFLELVGGTDCWVADYSGATVGGTPEQFIRLTNAEGNTLVIRPDVDVLEVFDQNGRCIASYVWEAWGERLPCGEEAYAFVSHWAVQKKAELESAARVEQTQYYGELKEFSAPVKIEMDRPVAIDETPFPDENYLGDGSIEDLLETTGYWEADYSGTAVGGTPERYIRLTNAAGHTLVVRTDANELGVFDRDGRCIAAYSCPVKSGKELYSFLCRWATQRKAELESAAQIEYFGTPDCDEFINLRKEPDVSSEPLLAIPLGDVFPVEKSENERFGAVEYHGIKGYVNLDYVMRLSECTLEQLFRCAAYADGAAAEAVAQALTERYHQDPDRFQAALSVLSFPTLERLNAADAVRTLLASTGVTLETPKVTVLTRKTEDFEIDGLREETPENQEQWREAVRTALEGAEAVARMDSAAFGGVMVGTEDVYLEYCADGSFYYHDNGVYVIRGEAARPLAALVQSVIEEKGIAPVRPQDLKGIRKATLVFGDRTMEVTDAATLAQIEKTLTQAEPIPAPACWFTSLLTLELENGQSKTISIATDSCGVYHSDGTFFQFGHGNEDFYSLFGLKASDISG